MKNRAIETRVSRPIQIGLLLVTALLIAACGGGDGEPAPQTPTQSTSPGPLDEGGIVCEFFAILLGGECVGIGNVPTCSDDPFDNPHGLPNCTDTATSGSSESTWITPRVYGMPDTEPNNSISTPAQATLNSRVQNGGRGGFLVDGTFNTSSDPADVFIFTLTASANIEFTLCFSDSFCSYSAGNRIDVGTAYISVLDQFGAVIWSASDDPDSGNIQELWLDAGVPHYVMLVAEDTMGSDLAYRLKVVEAQNQIIETPAEPAGVKPNAPLLSGWESGGTSDTMTIELTWLPPTQNNDGTALVDLSGYVIHYGSYPGGLSNSVTLNNPDLVTILIDLQRGEWSFVITAVNSVGQESDFSNEVQVFSGPPLGE